MELLNIIDERDIGALLDGKKKRNKNKFLELEDEMKRRGYDHTW